MIYLHIWLKLASFFLSLSENYKCNIAELSATVSCPSHCFCLRTILFALLHSDLFFSIAATGFIWLIEGIHY